MKERFTGIPKQEANRSAFFRARQEHNAPFTADRGTENARLEEVRERLKQEILDQFEGNVSPFFSTKENPNADKSSDQADIYKMESFQALGDSLEAAINLKILEGKINLLAGKGEERTPAEEAELNQCIVWYTIYRKLHREAHIRLNIADQLYFETRRANQPYVLSSLPKSPEVIQAIGAVHARHEKPAGQM